VTGATGHVGRVVADKLKVQGHEVRPVSRSAGVDLDDAVALDRAFSGADGAFIMIPPEVKAADLRPRQIEVGLKLASAVKDVPDESQFLRSPRALWLQIKSANVEEMTRKILDFGIRKIDLPSGLPESVPYNYFQAPGGQCFQLLPLNEDQSYYKGAGDGLNVAQQKEADALKEKAMSELPFGHHQKS